MKIAILGYGVIGSGVFEVLRENSELIAKKVGEGIEVTKVLDLRVFEGDPVSEVLTHDINDILEDESIETVVETMGGTGAAYKFVKECMLKGKNVCTSNKALIAKYGCELLQIARDKNINIFFGASVGGGIPIIRPLRQCLSQEYIEKIGGILNGTTNYILTQMYDNDMEFDKALAKAKAAGYAEANPAADIEGDDAARKISILASIIVGHQIDFEDVYKIGIDKITSKDVNYAKALGGRIKLIACAKLDSKVPCITVVPRLLFDDSELAFVNGVTNSIVVRGNMLGDCSFTGSGAGKLPTASAVVADVIDTLKFRNNNQDLRWKAEKLLLRTAETIEFRNLVIVNEENAIKVKEKFEVEKVIENERLGDEKALVLASISETKFDELIDGIEVSCRFRLKD